MSLYKYVPPERLDVLRHLRIRFTQPEAQNDPFEFRPLVDRFRRSEVAEESLSEQWERYYHEKFSQRFGPQVFAEIKKRCPTFLALQKSVDVAKADRQSDPASREEVFQELNRRVGILSLSDIPDSFLLWWRYASGQSGFVYEFDDKHPWFWAKTRENDDTHELRKVNYVDVPSSPYLAELDAHEVLYSKRKNWEYEREWRIIRPFVESPQRVGDDVYLFDVPPTALTGVIVGSSTTDASIHELVQIVTSNRNLAHLRIGCAHHVPSDSTVDVEFWSESVAQIPAQFGASTS